MHIAPFTPNTASTVPTAVTTASAQTTIVGSGGSLELYNAGPSTCFVEIGIAGQTAAVATGYPVPAGVTKIIGRGATPVVTLNQTVYTVNTVIAAITAAGTATLYVTSGEGV